MNKLTMKELRDLKLHCLEYGANFERVLFYMENPETLFQKSAVKTRIKNKGRLNQRCIDMETSARARKFQSRVRELQGTGISEGQAQTLALIERNIVPSSTNAPKANWNKMSFEEKTRILEKMRRKL